MKTKIMITVLSVLISTLIIISISSCGKDEEKTNQLPTCEITFPSNGQGITKGETITIVVDATDNDGSITEVRFFINNVGTGSATSFPFNYNWSTDNENLGNHTIKATSFDNAGDSSSDEITIELTEGGVAPIASYSVNVTSGFAPLTVNLTDQSSNNPTSYQWSFGDGGTSTQVNPTHTYNTSGSYTVSLIVSNEFGTDTETKVEYIVVSDDGNAPVANFIAIPTSGNSPLIVNFTDQSTNNSTNWHWDFGDGNTSSLQNPSHTYNDEGNYSVSLTVSNNYGDDTKSINGYIIVVNGGSNGCEGQTNLTYGGQTYEIVEIGDQCWMAENLNVGTMIDISQNQTNNGLIEKYCYENNESNCSTYGGLYQWDEMMQYSTQNGVQGICPDGWHIPSDAEWKVLEGTVDTYYGVGHSIWNGTSYRGYDVGKNLKSQNGWYNNGHGLDKYNFTALPAGSYNSMQGFFGLTMAGYFWSSTEAPTYGAWIRFVSWSGDGDYRMDNPVSQPFSVRCLKN